MMIISCTIIKRNKKKYSAHTFATIIKYYVDSVRFRDSIQSLPDQSSLQTFSTK